MSNEQTKRPDPVVRKQVIATETWGDLVVWKMKLSERLMITDIPAIDGEQAEERSRRVGRLFTSRLLAATVHGKDGALLYTADEWDVWLGDVADELVPVVKAASQINGFDVTSGDEAKNG